MISFWVVNELGSYGTIEEINRDKADAKLFLGICQNKYPTDATLIERIPDEEEVTDADIISTEEA